MARATIERERANAAHGAAPDGPDADTDTDTARSLPTPALLVVVALTAGIVAQGAYYPDGQRVMVAVLVAALVTGWRTHGCRPPTSGWRR